MSINEILYEITPSEQYLDDIGLLKKSGQKQLVVKILEFLKEMQIEPMMGTGNPEPLKHYGERSVWSRRINQKHRLVYEVFDENREVVLLSAYGHYNDK